MRAIQGICMQYDLRGVWGGGAAGVVSWAESPRDYADGGAPHRKPARRAARLRAERPWKSPRALPIRPGANAELVPRQSADSFSTKANLAKRRRPTSTKEPGTFSRSAGSPHESPRHLVQLTPWARFPRDRPPVDEIEFESYSQQAFVTRNQVGHPCTSAFAWP